MKRIGEFPMTSKERNAKWRHAHPDRVKKHNAEQRKKNPRAVQEWRIKNSERDSLYQAVWNLKKKFGLSLDAYNALLKNQKGACAICGTTDLGKSTRSEGKRLFFCVDHDHDTKRVRGLLCHH